MPNINIKYKCIYPFLKSHSPAERELIVDSFFLNKYTNIKSIRTLLSQIIEINVILSEYCMMGILSTSATNTTRVFLFDFLLTDISRKRASKLYKEKL